MDRNPDDSIEDIEDPGRDYGPQEYLGYLLIKEYHDLYDSPISWSKYWKLCCIADTYLMDELDVDVGFPRHWYKYGETAEFASIDRSYLQAPSARFWDGQEVLPDREIPETEFDVTEEQRDAVVEAVQWVLAEFGDQEVAFLKEHQYTEHAPNQFIQEYSELRAIFQSVDLDIQRLISEFYEDEEKNFVVEKLNAMVETFPNAYAEVENEYLLWDDTMRMMLENEADAVELKQFLDTFIERLSEIVLRFEHRSNIPEWRLAEWVEEKEEKKQQLRTQIEQRRDLYLTGKPIDATFSAMADIYDDTIKGDL